MHPHSGVTIFNTGVSRLNTHSTTALDTGIQRQYKAKDGHSFLPTETVIWQCSTESQEDLFQGNFADNNTIRLDRFVAVHDKNSLG